MQHLHFRPASIFLFAMSLFCTPSLSIFADTVSGGGYYIQQVITPLESVLQGNGYTLLQSSQQDGGINEGGGYAVTGVYGGTSTTGTTTSPTPPAPSGGTSSSGGGYFVFPIQTATGTVITVTTKKGVEKFSGSTCTSRVTFSGPIDYGSATNDIEDVKKLETFLNTYEGENLAVNGIYGKNDVEAVKRWQMKYRSFVLDPVGIKSPTGTVYTLSQRQIERQTTVACGEPVQVTSCPYFKEIASYGDKGKTVVQIQTFLNLVQGEKLPVSGVYGPLTRAATKRFQLAYKKDFFSRLRSIFISGNWNSETRKKANAAIGCTVTS